MDFIMYGKPVRVGSLGERMDLADALIASAVRLGEPRPSYKDPPLLALKFFPDPQKHRTKCESQVQAMVVQVMIKDLARMVMEYFGEPRLKAPPGVEFGEREVKGDFRVGMHRAGWCTDDQCDCLPEDVELSLARRDVQVIPRQVASKSKTNLHVAKLEWAVTIDASRGLVVRRGLDVSTPIDYPTMLLAVALQAGGRCDKKSKPRLIGLFGQGQGGGAWESVAQILCDIHGFDYSEYLPESPVQEDTLYCFGNPSAARHLRSISAEIWDVHSIRPSCVSADFCFPEPPYSAATACHLVNLLLSGERAKAIDIVTQLRMPGRPPWVAKESALALAALMTNPDQFRKEIRGFANLVPK